MYESPRRSSSPLCTQVMRRGCGPAEGPDAAREKQGEELTRAAALRESRPCTREAPPHCTSRRAVAILNQMRHRSSRFDDATAVPQQDDGPRRGPLSRTVSYTNHALTVLVQEDYDEKHSDRLRDGDRCLRFMTPAARGPPATSHSPLASTT